MAKKKSDEEFRAVTIYKLASTLASEIGTDEIARPIIEEMVLKFNEERFSSPLSEASVLDHVGRAVYFVANSEESEIKTHTLKEVDRLTAESYIDGYAGGFNVFMGACEKSLKALNDVMGFYMVDDLGKFDDRVRELHLAHNAIRFAMEQMADAYDEHMKELRDLWDLEDYIANID